MRSIFSILTVVLTVCAAGAARAADILVLDASAGLALHKGDIIDGAQEVTVPAGARVVLMDGSGQAVALDGPFHGAPGGKQAAGQPDLLKRLSAMVVPGPDKGRGTSIGAVRDMTVPPPRRDRPTDPWAIDVSSNGDRCVQARAPVLWRPDTQLDRTLVMRREPNSDWVQVAWPADRATLPWPRGLAPADGARYRVRLAGPLSTKFITLHMAPRSFANDAARLAWLYESGCRDQAETLIGQLAASKAARGTAARHGVFAE